MAEGLPAPDTTGLQINSLSQLNQLTQESLAFGSRMAMERDSVTRTIGDMLSALLTGRSSLDLRNSGSLMDRTMGHAAPMVGGAVAGLFGLSPANMMSATQNTFAYGGLQMTTSDGRYTPLNGFGPAASQLSNAAWNDVSRHFMHPGGAINLATTYGASRDDVADTMQELQRRNAFGGNIAGNLETLTGARLQELKGQAAGTGNKAMLQELESLSPGDDFATVNPAFTNRMTSWAQDTLKNVQELRTVLGNLKAPEIMAELERITGIDVGTPGNMGSAMQSFRSRIASGVATGMTERGALEFNAATTSTMDQFMALRTGDPVGSYYNASAGISGVVDRYAAASFMEQRAGGSKRQMGEIAAGLAGDAARTLTETPELLEAMWAASGFAEGSDPRNALMASIDQFSKGGTYDQRQAARMNMSRVYSQTTGMTSGMLLQEIGPSAMMDNIQRNDPAMWEHGGRAVMQFNQGAQIGDWQNSMRMLQSNSPFIEGLGGADRSAQFAQAIMQNIQPAQRNQIMEAMQSGGLESARPYLQGTQLGGLGDAFQVFTMANTHLMSRGSDVGEYLNHISRMADANPALGGAVTQTGMNSLDQQSSAYSQASLEYKGQHILGAGAAIEQGFFGGEVPLEDKMLIRHGNENTDPNDMAFLKLNQAGGISATTEQAKELAAHMKKLKVGKLQGADLYKLLGVKAGDDAALQKALETGAGGALVGQLMNADPDQIAGLDTDKDGNRGMTYAKDPKALRADYYNEVNGAQVNGSAAAGAQAGGGAAQPGSGQPLQIIIDAGGQMVSLVAKILGL